MFAIRGRLRGEGRKAGRCSNADILYRNNHRVSFIDLYLSGIFSELLSILTWHDSQSNVDIIFHNLLREKVSDEAQRRS